jgi:hypothetical protein
MFGRQAAMASRLAVALVATALAAGAAQAARVKEGTTLIVKCVASGPGLSTRVAGVEVAGQRPPSVDPEMSCAEAFNALANAGFKLVHSWQGAAAADGSVDAADYTVWRSNFGAGN